MLRAATTLAARGTPMTATWSMAVTAKTSNARTTTPKPSATRPSGASTTVHFASPQTALRPTRALTWTQPRPRVSTTATALGRPLTTWACAAARTVSTSMSRNATPNRGVSTIRPPVIARKWSPVTTWTTAKALEMCPHLVSSQPPQSSAQLRRWRKWDASGRR
jgi:hypothetical protein